MIEILIVSDGVFNSNISVSEFIMSCLTIIGIGLAFWNNTNVRLAVIEKQEENDKVTLTSIWNKLNSVEGKLDNYILNSHNNNHL